MTTQSLCEQHPGEADRRRGARRLGEVDPGVPPQAVAGAFGVQGLLHRVELLRDRPERHPEGEEAEPAHPDHLLPHPLHRLRRPVRAEHPADAQGGVHRPGRPVQVHRPRARHRPGVPAGVGRAALQLRVPAGHHLLLLPPAADGARPDPRRAPGAQVPRGGDGPGPLPRPRGELQDLPGEDPQGVRGARAEAPVHPDRLGPPRRGDPGGGPGDPARPDRPGALQGASRGGAAR